MKRVLEYPKDLQFVLDDMEKNVPKEQRKAVIKAMIENWKMGFFIAIWDDNFDRDVGIEDGMLLWKWNDDWELLEEEEIVNT